MVMLSTYERNFSRDKTGGIYVYRKLPLYLEGRAVSVVEEILPPIELEERFRSGNVSRRDFIREYLAYLLTVDADAFWQKHSAKTLIGRFKPHNDNLDNRFVIAEWLRMSGYEVKEVSHG